MHVSELQTKHITELLAQAEQMGIENANRLRKQDLVFTIVRKLMENGQEFICSGTLETLPDGYGFLRSAATAVRGEAPKLREWVKEVKEAQNRLHIDKAFSERSVNEGFSGGEKKRHEVLQLDLLKPKFAVMDETDSGLDVDALRIVSEGINNYQKETGGGIIMITHYKRILNYVKPDFVHVFADGKIVTSGGAELADELEEHGYDRFLA